MSPLTLGNSAHEVPTGFAELLKLLGSRPQPAVVHYSAGSAGGETPHGSRPAAAAPAITPEAGPAGGETPHGSRPAAAAPAITPEAGPAGGDAVSPEDRVELSGRVLANWANKLIGLFTDEHDLSQGDTVLVDMQLHWKAAAVALAAGALGGQVQLAAAGDEEADGDAQLVVTDRPLELIGTPMLGEAELAAVSHGLLDDSFAEATGQQIPAWVNDVSAEVRQYPDQLWAPLPAVALPPGTDTADGDPLVMSTWTPQSYQQMLGTWGAGGVVVLFSGEPGGARWETMLRNEGIA